VLKYLSYFLAAVLALLLIGATTAWLLLRAPDLPASEIESRLVDANDHFLELRPGLHYREEGAADKPVVLLLHGYGDSYATWAGWGRVLAPDYRVISLDLPGHGLTAAPADFVLDARAFSQIVIDFADRLQLPPFVLAGNSMGGGIAWKVALTAPQKLRGLVLAAAAGWPNEAVTGGSSPSLAFRILQHPLGRELLARIDNRPLIKQGLTAQVHDKSLITDALIDRWALYQRYPGHRPILMSAAPTNQLTVTAEQLAGLKVPTLVLHGDYDPLIPVEHSRRFAAAIPGAKLIVYPDVGHLIQREIPERSARDTAAFIATLP
jgi:pimeloyl-ACP methyl ester carboxylesterase